MSRGLPYSLGIHVLAMILLLLLGSRVQQRPVRTPRAIKVQMVQLPRTTPPAEKPVEQPVDTPPPVAQPPVMPPKEVPRPQPQPKVEEAEKPRNQPKTEPTPNEALPDQENPESAPAQLLVSGPSVQGTDDDFPFAWYLTRVEGLIARNWNPRQIGFGRRAVVTCAVHFRIARNGVVSQVTLVEESGVGVYDRESLRAVQTTRLPPLPPEFRGASLGVTFIFNLEPDF
jgi:protein TonB